MKQKGDTNYEELILDLKHAVRNTDIEICEHNDNNIVTMDCSVKNPVLHKREQYWGNTIINNILHKYSVAIEWIDNKRCYVYPCNKYFIDNPDYRLIYPNYEQMTIELKRILCHYDIDVWTLNDIDFFTSCKMEWFERSKAVFIIRVEGECPFDLNSTCIKDDCINALIYRFNTTHNLTLKHSDVSRQLMVFTKPEKRGKNGKK